MIHHAGIQLINCPMCGSPCSLDTLSHVYSENWSMYRGLGYYYNHIDRRTGKQCEQHRYLPLPKVEQKILA